MFQDTVHIVDKLRIPSSDFADPTELSMGASAKHENQTCAILPSGMIVDRVAMGNQRQCMFKSRHRLDVLGHVLILCGLVVILAKRTLSG